MLTELGNIGLKNSGITSFVYQQQIGTVKSDSFSGCEKLGTIDIPNANAIEDGAFSGCHGLLSIEIPGIETIGNIFGADKPKELTHVKFSEGTKDVGTSLNGLSALQSISFPNSLTSVSNGAFSGCQNIHELKFGKSVVLENNAFNGLANIVTLEFPLKDTPDVGLSLLNTLDTVTLIKRDDLLLDLSHEILKNCPSRNIIFEDNADKINSFTDFYFNGCKNIKELNISNSQIVKIPSNFLSGCESLTGIFLPSTVRRLEQNSLYGTTIQSFSIPPNVEEVNAFGIEISVDSIPTGVKTIGIGTFENIKFFNPVISLPNYNGNIIERMFCGSNITSVDINVSNSGGIVGIKAFANCSELTCVEFRGSTVNQFESSAFYNCNGLYSDELINGAATIGDYAFYGTKISEIDVTETNTIGDCAFGMTDIESIEMGKDMFEPQTSTHTAKNLGSVILNGCANVGYIGITDTSVQELNEISDFFGRQMYVDYDNYEDSIKSMYEAFKYAFGLNATFKNFVVNVEKDNLVITHDGSQEYNCLILNESGDTLVSCDPTENDFKLFLARGGELPYTITSILKGAFDDSKNILSVIEFNNVTVIPESLFEGSTSLQKINASGKHVTEVGKNAFYGCSKLTCIGGFQNVTKIEDTAFCKCAGIPSVDFLYQVETLGERSFAGCTGLSDITFGDYLTSIGLSVMENCTSLNSVRMYVNQPAQRTISKDMFSGCSKLSTLEIVNQINITSNSFRGTESLKSVYFKNMTETESDSKLGIGNEQYSANNTFGFTNGTSVYIGRNEYKYPSYVILNNLIKKICNAAMAISIADEKIALTSYDAAYNGSCYLNLEDFTNLDAISADAFNGNDSILGIYLPVGKVEKTERGSFGGMNSLEFISIAKDYSDECSGYAKHFTGDDETHLKIVFNDGILQDGIFVRQDETFISINGIITRVRLENTVQNVTINAGYSGISSYAFTADRTITALNTGYVRNIQSNAFYDNSAIRELSVGKYIETISSDAFRRTVIEKLTLPGVIKKIENYGFNDSKTLNSITYGNGTEEIGPSAMIDTTAVLTALNFPNTLVKIGEYAYAEPYDTFPRLDNVNFDELDNLSAIDKFAFYNSIHTLKDNTLSLNNSQLSIFDYAFAYNRYSYIQRLNDLKFLEPTEGTIGARYIGIGAFEYNRFRRMDFGNSIDVIDDLAFAYPRYKYENTVFPNSLRKIGTDAFKKNIVLNPYKTIKNMFYFENDISAMSSIFDITIDDHFMAYNRAGFTDHTCLSALWTDFYTGFVYIYENAMNFCPSGAKIDIFEKILVSGQEGIPEVYVPKYIKTIGKQAFMNNTTLRVISAEPGLNIQESAFYGCINFERFNNPESKYYLLSASDYSFYQCNSLENIRLSPSATYVGNYSFAGCQKIPEFYDDIDGTEFRYYKLSVIGDGAFQSCYNLTRFDICQNLSSFGMGVFDYCGKLDNINIDMTSEEFRNRIDSSREMSALIRNRFLNVRNDYRCMINFSDISYTNDGKVKMDNEFVETYEIGGISTDLGVKKLKYDKFVDHKWSYLNLSSIVKVDQFVFCSVEKLNSISFLKNSDTGKCMDELGDYCFCNCSNIYNFNGGYLECRKIGKYCFMNCKAMTSIGFDVNVIESIGCGAFYGTALTELKFVNIPVGSSVNVYEKRLKNVIGFVDGYNRNPLLLPSYCVITFVDTEGTTLGKYTYLFADIMNSDIDINRNQQIFIDKTSSSIRPVTLVKAPSSGKYPVLVNNTFHANIVGRWK